MGEREGYGPEESKVAGKEVYEEGEFPEHLIEHLDPVTSNAEKDAERVFVEHDGRGVSIRKAVLTTGSKKHPIRGASEYRIEESRRADEKRKKRGE